MAGRWPADHREPAEQLDVTVESDRLCSSARTPPVRPAIP